MSIDYTESFDDQKCMCYDESMSYRIVYWKAGEKIEGADLKDREAASHAALHLHAGEQCDETRVYERTTKGLFGYDDRIILRIWR